MTVEHAPAAWSGPSPEERKHQQAFLLTLLRWCLFAGPIATVLFVVTYLHNPHWPELALVVMSVVTLGVTLWSLPRVRRGELRLPTRALLTAFMVLVTLHALAMDLRSKATTLLGLPCILLLAIALEPPAVAFGWAGAAVAALVAGIAAPRLTTLNISPVLLWLFDLGTVQTFLLLTLLGRSITRHLREALAASEYSRAAVERSNARLAEQRATLERAQAELASFASGLEASNRELQSFAAVVSRDLLAPVRELEGDTQRLQERYARQLDEAGREHIQGIAESARHMDALVNGLLAYSSAPQPRAELEPVDVGALLERVDAALHLRSRADVVLPAPLPTVWAHRLRLEQALVNLIENAIKFQRPGARPVVTLEWVDRPGAWELAVRDNGIGIDPRHFDKIFGIFQRLHLQNEYEGTGIGLAIVHKAIEEHGGKVWVESAPGQGSTFRFTLPKPRALAGAPSGEEVPRDERKIETSPALPRLMPVKDEPVRVEQELAFTAEGSRLLRATMALAFWSLLASSPMFVLVYVVPFVRLRTWEAFPAAAAGILAQLVSIWGLRRVRRGEAMAPARALLAVMVVVMLDHLLHREDEVLVTGCLALAGVLVVATALERASFALRWTWVVSAVYLGAMVLRRTLPMRSLNLGPLAMEAVRFTPVVQLLFILLVGMALMHLLRQALSRSRAARSELEQGNATLQRQRVELLRAQAHLSTLTENLSRINRDLRSFAYVASHDLRAPLRALSHYSRFLQEDCAAQLDEEGRRLVERIAAAARHMDALVADLLEYSRIGRIHLDPEWVNLREVVEHVLVAHELRSKASVAIPAELPAVWGFRAHLEQVFRHLLENAIRFQRKEVAPAIAIGWADRGEAWELSVRDNGIGIAEKDFETIFRLFGQLHPERGGGTGIGLPIVKKAVEEHGGRIWVESSPGQGSVFRFTLPKAAGAPRAQERSS